MRPDTTENCPHETSLRDNNSGSTIFYETRKMLYPVMLMLQVVHIVFI